MFLKDYWYVLKVLQTRSLSLFSFSWIKMGCNVKNALILKKISDIDIYLSIEKGLRGGISYICKRYSEANNKYVKTFDPAKPSKCISYLDMNNLCGQVMSGYLPYGGFK